MCAYNTQVVFIVNKLRRYATFQITMKREKIIKKSELEKVKYL